MIRRRAAARIWAHKQEFARSVLRMTYKSFTQRIQMLRSRSTSDSSGLVWTGYLSCRCGIPNSPRLLIRVA